MAYGERDSPAVEENLRDGLQPVRSPSHKSHLNGLSSMAWATSIMVVILTTTSQLSASLAP